MSLYDEHLQKGLIITDDISNNPVLDFNLYRDAIVNIIRNSYPKFTIGIYGDWGTGKTTLMHLIDKILQSDKDIVIVRYESWRYEREEQFALIPLLKSIAFALPKENEFLNLEQKLKRGSINFAKKIPDIISSIISKHIGDEVGEMTREVFDSFKKEFNTKMELLAEIDRDTLYFDGFEDIKEEIKKIRNSKPNFKIVVFIDDLDRCSPEKTLEVLESIKIFLGMEGFVYVLGLSHDIVTKLIDIKYKETGIEGQQYIKKMIQIPITLPKWNSNDIMKLVRDLVNRRIIDEKYKSIINKNIQLISIAIENNPREIKRFINNFIVAFEIFSNIEGFRPEELILIQAIQLRWSSFYNLIIKEPEKFEEELEKYVKINDDFQRFKTLESDEIKDGENYDLRIRRLLRNYNSNSDLWEFINKNFDTFSKIQNWDIYRRATEIGREPIEKEDPNRISLDLLRTGKVEEFNNRRDTEFKVLNLNYVDLSKADLSGAKLSKADLSGAKLSGAKLSGADLSGADLTHAKLSKADLSGANLSGANLSGANLSKANLARAYLSFVTLSDANLSDANLSDANLSNTKLSKANLTRANLKH